MGPTDRSPGPEPLAELPDSLMDEYEQDNWRDSRMAADLWNEIFCD